MFTACEMCSGEICCRGRGRAREDFVQAKRRKRGRALFCPDSETFRRKVKGACKRDSQLDEFSKIYPGKRLSKPPGIARLGNTAGAKLR